MATVATRRTLACGAHLAKSWRNVSSRGDGRWDGELLRCVRSGPGGGFRGPDCIRGLDRSFVWFGSGTAVGRGFASKLHRWGESAPRMASSVRDSTGIGGLRRVATSVESGAWPRWKSPLEFVGFYGKCYFELSKARLSAFVVSTAAVGFVMGSGEAVDWAGLAWTSAGTMLTAASANAFNQILEVENDARMRRTMRRPLPSGRMGKVHALAFAATAGAAGVAVLACKATDLAAELGALNILLYALVYTPLKQIHSVNTWVGAVVGAVPPLMGWAAAAGDVSQGALVLAAGLYFWQVPHFMSLAFLCRDDYTRGGYKMLSLLDKSGRRTALCALRNSAYLLPLGFLAQHWGTTSGYFAAENLVLTAGMGATSALFYLRPSTATARRLFRVSLLYLPVFMAAMVIHRNPNQVQRLAAAGPVELEEGWELMHGVAGGAATEDSEERVGTPQRSRSWKGSPQPPISFVSAAPFPFLPAPDYY